MNAIRACAAAIVAAGLFATPVAFAQTANSGDALSLSQVESRLNQQGFRVLEIERDDGRYEVKAWNSDNRCVELDVDRRTGAILRTESDDDCGVGDDDDRRSRSN
jgi:hypothetical protein